jgi:organic radical activating enzyme
MSNKTNLDSVIEIYITNECNLTCKNCNRYNNYNFSGHYSWQANQQAIMAWSKRITAPLITIIGGEPALHPDLYEWTELVCTAWPDCPVIIQSNGTIRHPRTLDIKLDFKNIGFCASLHQEGMMKLLVKNKFMPNRNVINNTEFTECALVDQGTHFEVHNSDPKKAFEACAMRHSHTIFEGRLYKCPMVAVLPEFIKQYQVNLTESQSNNLFEYQSLTPDCSQQQLEQFVNNRNSHVEQCRLCPETHILNKVTFHPSSKNRPKLADQIPK